MVAAGCEPWLIFSHKLIGVDPEFLFSDTFVPPEEGWLARFTAARY